jgi:glycosyltransferase involved in cell wall biosynthesis
MLSIVLPVHNALDSLKITLESLIQIPELSQLIIVDDYSSAPTKEFIESLVIAPNKNVHLIKVRNDSHSWTNASWNKGVELATRPYIAVCNSDVTFNNFPPLQRLLSYSTIACPYMQLSNNRLQRLDPLIERIDPFMIQGAFFVFKLIDKDLFPVPPSLVHWYGDRYLADKANSLYGVSFSPVSTITHGVSHSAKEIPSDVYNERIFQDLLAYEALTGKDESLVREQIKPF